MGILRKAFQPVTGPGTFWPQDWYSSNLYNAGSKAGVNVNSNSAFGLTAFWAAVRVISEDIAKLPFKVYEDLNPGKRTATEHPLYPVLHDRANPIMSAFTWREVSVSHLVSWGNCYSEIVRDRNGIVRELWPIPPDRVQVKYVDNVKFYRVRIPGGGTQDIDAADIFHVPGLGYDGLVGYNPIDVMAKAIGVGLAAQEYAERIWANDARPGGWLEVPADIMLDEKGKRKLRQEYDARHRGLTNAQRIAILEDGIVFHEANVTPETAQFIETRKFQTREIARAFRIPPHKIGDLDQATFSNIEQQALEYVQDCLAGWAGRLESQIRMQLLAPPYFAELLFDGLLRGDSVARSQALWIQRQAGVINADEWRDMENRNPLPNGDGQVYWQPLNQTAVGQVPPGAEPEEVKPPAGALNPLDPTANPSDPTAKVWAPLNGIGVPKPAAQEKAA
ncbi:MAG TPA: phage portal protein [Gaiellaceae bacterium]|nr:phage portal protein [Gaiellaceae bacterium]